MAKKGGACSPQVLRPWQTYGIILAAALIIAVCITLAVNVEYPNHDVKPSKPGEKATVYMTQCSAHKSCSGQQGNCCPNDGGLWMSCCDEMNSGATIDRFKGMCYAPTPTIGKVMFPTEDFMAHWSEPLWDENTGNGYRDDLALMQKLGVNMIRVYGSDASILHQDFLDRAHKLDMGVMVGISDSTYTGHSGACGKAGFDCSKD